MKILFALTMGMCACFLCCSPSRDKKIEKHYYPNGKLSATSEMVNGKKNGVEKLYFEDGNLFMIQHFKDDLIVDSFYQFDKENPKKLLLKGYSELESHVVVFAADSNNIVSENYYRANMIGSGFVKLYYKNGKVAGLTEYKNGKRDGVQINYWHTNGNVKSIAHFVQGGGADETDPLRMKQTDPPFVWRRFGVFAGEECEWI